MTEWKGYRVRDSSTLFLSLEVFNEGMIRRISLSLSRTTLEWVLRQVRFDSTRLGLEVLVWEHHPREWVSRGSRVEGLLRRCRRRHRLRLRLRRRRRDARRHQTLGFRLMDHFSSLESSRANSPTRLSTSNLTHPIPFLTTSTFSSLLHRRLRGIDRTLSYAPLLSYTTSYTSLINIL